MHVIATAGHVDHGKSTLIRALTGMEPDRWAEERRRGMTIDLGYAWTTLPDGTQLAFVDVPGHQKFINNMLAGIGPVPAVLLVVAADEGWGRQTGEHVAALNSLGVRHGVLAITRSDLADPDLALEEARDFLTGTTLEDIEAVAVSPVTNTGLDQLQAALARMTAGLVPPTSSATRLWVDRVFTITGAGTVVTGTLGTGTIRVGDDLTISSTGQRVHVRELQALNTPVSSASAVARVAVNLRGVKKTQIRRGDALITAGQWADTRTMDVRLVHAAAAVPAQPLLYIGSAAVTTRLRPLGRDTARLTLQTPLPLHVGERGLLRDPGHNHVIAGIIILDTYPPALRRRGAAGRRAEELTAMTDQVDPASEIHRRHAVPHHQLVASGILGPGDSAPLDAVILGEWYIDREQWTNWQHELQVAVDQWASVHPLAPGMPPSATARQLALPDAALLEPLVRLNPALTIDSTGIHRPSTAAAQPTGSEAALDELVQRLSKDPFAAPESPELEAAGLTERRLATAVTARRLLRVAPGVYLLPSAPDAALNKLASLPQPFTLSEARKALNTTRRVAVPLLEFLDRRHATIRVDSQHRTIRA